LAVSGNRELISTSAVRMALELLARCWSMEC